MYQEKRKSTSSIQMGPLKRSKSVISLGKRLVEELGLEPSVDTLGRWMAHYIAELIKAVEEADNSKERRKNQEKCYQTILKLWEHRSSLPDGARPLSSIEGVLKAIKSLRGEKTPWLVLSAEQVGKIGGRWMEFAKTVQEKGLRICRIAALTAIAEGAFDKEKRWVREQGKMLSKEEREIIELLGGWLSEKIQWQTTKDRVSIGDLEPHERSRKITGEIDSSIKQINKAFELLQSKG